MTAFQVLRRHPVGRIEVGKGTGTGFAVHLVAQEGELPRIGIGERLGAHHEDGGFRERGRALGRHTVQVERIGIAEGEGVAVLAHLHAVIDAATHKAGALEGFLAGRADHEDRRLFRLELAHQVLPVALAEHGLAHDGRIERTEPQLDEGLTSLVQPHLLRLHHDAAHRFLLDQGVPVRQLGAFGQRHVLGLRADGLLHDADLLGNRRARGHQHLVLGNHRHGGARDGIHANHFAVGMRGADLDLVLDRLADVLVVEVDQRRFGNAEQQDGLGVLEHFHAHEFALVVHADQRHHRLAGIRRRVGDVGGEHHITEFGLAVRAVGLDVRWLSLALGKRRRSGEHILAGQQGTHVLRCCQIRRQLGFVRLRSACACAAVCRRQCR